MTASTTLDSILAAITHDTWYDYLPLVADAYADADDWDASEAVRWMMSKKKRPYRYGTFFGWRCETNRMDLEHNLPLRFFKIVMWCQDPTNRAGWGGAWIKTTGQDRIHDCLVALVSAWKRGYRP